MKQYINIVHTKEGISYSSEEKQLPTGLVSVVEIFTLQIWQHDVHVKANDRSLVIMTTLPPNV
jgi:hypothetical protein